MKKALLTAGIACMLFAAACIKVAAPEPEPAPAVDPCPDGTIQFVNNSTNPYDVYVNGAKVFQQQGKTSKDYNYAKGSYTLRVLQVSGYAIYPTDKSYSATLAGCDKSVISYP